MSVREALLRHNLIIRKLRRKPSSFKEIADYLSFESEIQGYNFNVSKRTFNRDVADIRVLYNIDIQYNHSKKLYCINLQYEPEFGQRLLEAFDILNSINEADKLSDYVQLEKRKPQGTENMSELIHSIKDRFQVKFSYQKYWEDEIVSRRVEPYVLKEFKYRWYLLAKDIQDNRIKIFALDRITGLEVFDKKNYMPPDFNFEETYQHCFGIMSPNSENPEEVVLSFDPFQGKYVKSLPLHSSQEIIKDDEDELVIKLKVYITHDFLMELLSYGDTVKAIAPEKLINSLKTIYQKALNLY